MRNLSTLFTNHRDAIRHCLAAALLVTTAAAAEPLSELTAIRDQLRGRLDARLAELADAEAPRDLRLDLDQGLAKRSGRRLLLRRRGDAWGPAGFIDEPEDLRLQDIDTSALVLSDDGLQGPVVVRWIDPEDPDATGQEQRFTIDARVERHEPRLVLTFHRFLGGSDWVQAWQPAGSDWHADRDLETPRQFTTWGPFTREMPVLSPGADGGYALRIPLTYAGEDRMKEGYDRDGHPVVTATFAIHNGLAAGTWQRSGAGGKHYFGTGIDRLSGFVGGAVLRGRYVSKGSLGEWAGDLQGPIMPSPTTTAILDTLPSGATPVEQGAGLYRQIKALDLALHTEGLSLQEALDRSLVPVPVGDEATPYLAGLVAHARPLAGTQPPTPLHSGALPPGDPAFGPFQADIAALPGSDEAPNQLAAVASGSQRWAFLDRWQVTGPFAVYDDEAEVRLPELLPIGGAAWQRRRAFTEDGELSIREDAARWVPAGADGALVAVPFGEHTAAGDLRFCTFYATTTLDSAIDQEVTMAAAIEGWVMVWLDEVLIWDSGRRHPAAEPSLFTVPLHAGRNRLLVRCATTTASNEHFSRVDWFEGYGHRPNGRVEFTTFALHVATAGAPGGAHGEPTGERFVAQRGWRGDGTGLHPSATPPLAWDLAEGTNVAWRSELPPGRSDLVHHGDALYLMAEPHHLICLDAATGAERWRRSIDRLRIAGDTRFAALGPDPLAAWHDARRQAERLRTEAKASKDEALAAQAEALLAPFDALERWTKEVGFGQSPDTATVAPVLFGDALWVQCGTGAIGCYGLDGTPRWERVSEHAWCHPDMGQAHLVDGLFIVQVANFDLVAFAADSGEERWHCRATPKRVTCDEDRPESLGNGTVCLRLRNGAAQRTVLVTGDGAVVDAADGRLLFRDVLGVEAARAAPEAAGDTVCFTTVLGSQALRLWLDPEGRVNARSRWLEGRRCGRGQAKTVTQWGPAHWMEGPLLDDGLMYSFRVDSAHVPQHAPLPWHQLDRNQLSDGSPLPRRRAILRDCTDPTVPLVKAGRYLLCTDGGAPVAGFQGTTEYGQIALVDTEGGIWPVARNRTGHLRASPLPVGDRLYLRQFDGVVCLQVTGEKGRRYQEEALGRTLFDEIPARELPPPVLALEAEAALEGDTQPASRLRSKSMPERWLLLGPLPGKGADDPLAGLGGAAGARPVAGSAVTVAGKELAFAPVAAEFLAGGKLDVLGPIGNQTPARTFYYTVLDNGQSGVYRYMNAGKGMRTWLGGREIADGDYLRLGLGRYPLLIEVTLGKLPPFATRGGMFIQPTFFKTSDPGGDFADWISLVSANRHRLERLVQEQPDSNWAGKARLVLEQLEQYEREEAP